MRRKGRGGGGRDKQIEKNVKGEGKKKFGIIVNNSDLVFPHLENTPQNPYPAFPPSLLSKKACVFVSLGTKLPPNLSLPNFHTKGGGFCDIKKK